MSTQMALRRAAARAAYEDGSATLEAIADITGWSLRLLAARAAREGWRAPVDRAAAHSLERLQAELSRWIGLVEALGRAAEAGTIDKAQIDAVASAIRAIEKASDLVRASMTEKQQDNDVEKAVILEHVNARIVELAKEFAAAIAAERARPEAGLEDSR
ncbi:hypothetical protein FQ775_12385 [Nitratireductor mangrovi]|uniref:Uncharacterized protein n=1 Tax=Nitratireductor mangrovi TaxID=2599600 RepID=A0A5B8L0D3_9HYPH|nr:hypothetical protein [Nitratireductor mangrovi]QDZ01110.1 hypothetical protein FQ775_12385 [Nitratireductor mangrovi]